MGEPGLALADVIKLRQNGKKDKRTNFANFKHNPDMRDLQAMIG